MLCYRDRVFCKAIECKNEHCFRHIKPEIYVAASKIGLPVDVADFSESCKYYVSNKDRICRECSHFLGGGDWNLCCDLKYDLTYETCRACDMFEERK